VRPSENVRQSNVVTLRGLNGNRDFQTSPASCLGGETPYFSIRRRSWPGGLALTSFLRYFRLEFMPSRDNLDSLPESHQGKL
jgi:hypothetical protein